MSKNHNRILVTGATGFVGQALLSRFQGSGHLVRAALRSPASVLPATDSAVIGDIGPHTEWRAALNGVDCVVHLAARTHVLVDHSDDPLRDYRRINVLGTARLARQAAAAGVRRLVFLSSVKVNGEATPALPFRETDPPEPLDAYGASKLEAEVALRDIGSESGMEIVVLRPPLVYGPGVRANLLRLLDLVSKGIPLPLASVNNRRSLIYVNNLADAIVTCAEAPAAAGATFLVSDNEDVSTPDLIRKIAAAMSKPPRLLPCPPGMLVLAATMLGRRSSALRLTGSLTVDSSRIRQELGWQPRYSLDQGLKAMVRWYHRGKH